MHMFQKRAKGTALAKDSHAMLTLQTSCSKFSHGTSLTESDFIKGVTDALRESSDGPVAQWILQELQDFACAWKRIEMPAAAGAAADAPLQCYYARTADGTTTWSKPASVAAMEELCTIRDSPEITTGAARRTAKKRAKTRARTLRKKAEAAVAAASDSARAESGAAGAVAGTAEDTSGTAVNFGAPANTARRVSFAADVAADEQG